MATVREVLDQKGDRLVLLCDFSPPRGSASDFVEQARSLDADFICVAYSPGKSVRVAPNIVAHIVKRETGLEVVFNLATRDMNRIAIQSYLLGSQLLGLENVVVLKGDEFTGKERHLVKDVNDFTPTEMIRAVKQMNEGVDFRGRKLGASANFCVGATFDLSRGIEREAQLAHKKALAGADFFLAQSVYDLDVVDKFHKAYRAASGGDLDRPVFYGVQVLRKDSPITFGNVPKWIARDLERGRKGAEIATELINRFVERGPNHIYLVPPILKGGVRDYEAAQRVVASVDGLR